MKPSIGFQKLILTLSFTLAVSQSAMATELAPYFYYWGVGKVNRLTDAKSQMGLSNATYAFIVSKNGCFLEGTLADSLTDVQNYVQSGGKLIMSFGGAGGVYLEVACTNDDQLFNMYDKVIIDTGTHRIDFDVEGNQALDTDSHYRRARVLARLQAKYPDLYLSFTLPGWLNGLGSTALNVLKITKDAGVKVNIVNVMSMDWGADNIRTMVNPATLGQATIDTIRGAMGQLKTLYPEKTAVEINAMIGITPMIGTNDDNTTFTLDDAVTVTNFAKENGIGHMAYWAFQRDQAQTQPGATVLNSYSGVVQTDFQFFNIFKGALVSGSQPMPASTSVPVPVVVAPAPVVVVPAPAPTPSIMAAIVNSGSTVSQASLIAGQLQSIQANIKSNVNLSALTVDIRVTDNLNNVISKKSFSNFNLVGNVITPLQFDFQTSSTLAAGNYKVAVGVWDAAWNTLYYENVTNFSVSAPVVVAAPVINVSVAQVSISKSSLPAGGVQSVAVSLKSATALKGLNADIRIYDSNNVLIARNSVAPFDLATGPTNQTITLQFNYQSPTNLAIGKYSVQVGVWSSTWDTYLFQEAGTFSVVAPVVSYPKWVMYSNYKIGQIVLFTDGKLYIALHDNPGYIPTISTYFWKPYVK